MSYPFRRLKQSCMKKLDNGRNSTSLLFLLIYGIGILFLLLTAFHGNIWFDESYSVGIASKSFSEIWSYGSCDVHPVLYYCALHVLYLVSTGIFSADIDSVILVYRIFTVFGVVSLALLGFTHIRKDYGAKVGILYSFVVFSIPYIALMAVEIRMYTWAMFTVMLCYLYGLRIVRLAKDKSVIPLHWWVLFALSSLASAYLHYFAAISVFLVNAFVLIFLLKYQVKEKRNLVYFSISAILQLLAYTPWLLTLLTQISVVSNTYWAKFYVPYTIIELLAYPFVTSPLSFALRGEYGLEIQIVSIALIVALITLLVLLIINRPKRAHFASKLGILLYLGVLVIGCIASILMNSLIVYYRYLSVALGPLLLSLALLLSQTKYMNFVKSFCITVLLLAILNQILLINDDYSEANQSPLNEFNNKVAECKIWNNFSDVLVLSSDIGFMGVTSDLYPDIKQTYLDWQPGNWGYGYKVYEPALTSVKSWDEALEGYEGAFIVLGQGMDDSIPKDISDIASKDGVEEMSISTFYRPYERTYFSIAVMNYEPIQE